MKKIAALVSLLLISLASATAQNRDRDASIETKVPLNDSLLFVSPEFVQGIVYFKDNQTANGLLNIKTIMQRACFIDNGTDTLDLVNESSVARIYLGRRLFIKTKGKYVEIIGINNDSQIGVCRQVEIIDMGKTGAFGSVSNTTSITTVSSIATDGKRYDLHIDDNTKYIYRETPYLIDGNKCYICTKKAFIKQFPDKKDFIEQFTDDNKLDFDKVEDAMTLFNALK